jgi:hypothetical protein
MLAPNRMDLPCYHSLVQMLFWRGMLRCLLLLMWLLPGITAKAQSQQADTFLMVRMSEVEVKDAAIWKNDTARYRFNQLRYYVTTVLPYVQAASKVFADTRSTLDNEELGKAERRKILASREAALRGEFEDKIKALNETQGLLLIKLIARQTGLNIYTMLRDLKNPITAVKWQAWARLHGFNLNRRYQPEDEPLLERVMISLGYDLPEFYDTQKTATAIMQP